MIRIYDKLLFIGMNQNVHIFQEYGAQQGLIFAR